MSRADMLLKPGGTITADRVIKARLRDQNDSALTTNMAVNGSSTPVTYSYEFSVPAAIGHLVIYISDGQAFSEVGFGALSALTNGVQVNVGNQEIFNFKNNLDVVASLTRPGIPGSLFGKADKTLNGMIDFKVWGGNQGGIYIKANQTISVVIRDNLSELDYLEISVHAIEID